MKLKELEAALQKIRDQYNMIDDFEVVVEEDSDDPRVIDMIEVDDDINRITLIKGDKAEDLD